VVDLGGQLVPAGIGADPAERMPIEEELGALLPAPAVEFVLPGGPILGRAMGNVMVDELGATGTSRHHVILQLRV
jgi:hypothetical protein